MLKKATALLLTLVMTVSFVSVPAYAEDGTESIGWETVSAAMDAVADADDFTSGAVAETDNASQIEELENGVDFATCDEVEPNDTPTTADRIYSGDYYFGRAGGYDVDLFKFTVYSRSEISLVGVADYNCLSMGIFESTMEDCLIADRIEDYEYEYGNYSGGFRTYLSAGTYYICILSLTKEYSDYGILFNIYSASGVSAPSITSHPQSVTVGADERVSFSVSASGTGLSYQWQMLSPTGTTWNNCTVSSATSSTMQFTATSGYNGCKFRCKVSNSGGTVYSSEATLTVKSNSGSCGSKLTWTLKNGVLTINGTGEMSWDGDYAPWYEMKDTITRVAIQSGVTSIYEEAFSDCSALTAVSMPQSVKVIGAYAFDFCTKLATITIPNGVTTIGKYAFRDCVALTSVTIPQSVTTIGVGAFDECTKLASITVSQSNSNYTGVGGVLFDKNKTTLVAYPAGKTGTSYTIPDGVTAVGDRAFAYAENLTAITIPESMATIGAHAFVCCDGLTSLTIPGNVRSIEDSAFNLCNNLASITVDPDNADYVSVNGVLYDKGMTTLIEYPAAKAGTSYTVPDGVITIGDYAIDDNENLTSITIPGSVTTIGWGAFGDCSGLTSITIPASVTSIDSFVFTGDNLTKVIFLGDAPVISEFTFGLTKSITAYYPTNNATWTSDKKQNYGGTITWVAITPITITSQPEDAFGVGKVSFTTAAQGNGLQYRWQWSADGITWGNTSLSGYNTPVLTVTATAAINGRQYRCLITDSYGAAVPTAAAKLVYGTPVTVDTQPTDQYAPSGYVYFTVAAKGDGLTYQWQWSSDGKNWNNTTLTGCNTNKLRVTANATNNGRQYRCVITNQYGNTVTSSAAKLIKGTRAEITTQPSRQIAPSGYVYFAVAAKGDGLTYQWQWSSDGKTWGNTSLTGYNTNTLRVTANATNNGRQYRCIIADQYGNKVTSEPAELIRGTKSAITTQPADQIAPSGYVYFTVAAKGDGLTYQWQWSADGKTWGNTSLTGYNTNTLRVASNATNNGRQYRCVVSDKYGSIVTSDAAKLIRGTKAAVTADPDDQYSPSGYAYFTVGAKGDGLTYQWQWSADGKKWNNTTLTGYNTKQLRVGVSSTTNGRQYRCIITDKYGTKVTSAAATLVKGSKAEITAQPSDQRASVGYVYFAVTAKGDGLTYQWQWSSDGKTWGSTTLSGYNTAKLRVGVSNTTNGRQYRCVITDKYGNVEVSDPAGLTKVPAPAVTAHPEDVYTDSGYVYFEIAATGEGIKYQWQYSEDGETWNACADDGYDTDALCVEANADNHERQYRCVVTDQYGASVVSDSAILVKGVRAVVTQQPSDQRSSIGRVNFVIAAEGHELRYQWQWSSNGTSWSNTSLTGYNTAKLSVAVSDITNGRQYRCVVTDKYGNVATSDPAKLTKAPMPEITADPEDVYATVGYVYFEIAATGEGIKYQWQYSEDGETWNTCDFSGCNTAALRVEATDDNDHHRYRCVVTDQYGVTATSEAATLFVGVAKGSCGANLIWLLDRNGVLTIAGTGTMYDFSSSKAPWTQYSDQIISAVIKPGVTTIGDYAFDECEKMDSVDISETVTTIGRGAFAFSAVASVNIPGSVILIEDNAFTWCDDLCAINVSVDNTRYCSIDGILFNKAVTKLICCPRASAVSACVIPDSVTTIEAMAFYSCKNLASVIIPDGVTTIGDDAFHICDKLTSVDIPGSVTTIGETVFRSCGNLESINVSAENSKYCSIDGVLFDKAVTKLIYCPSAAAVTDYVIPDSVTTILRSAFWFCDLTTLTIPVNVTAIGSFAFSGCADLTTVYYGGTADEWSQIFIEETGNDELISARIIYTEATAP